MIARARRFEAWRLLARRPRAASAGASFGRMLGQTGTGTRRRLTTLVELAALAATVIVLALRRDSWRLPVRATFRHALHALVVRSVGTTLATGLLLGFALATQAVYWLEATGQTGFVGKVIVLILVREITPLLVGLIVFGRVGTSILIELAEAQPKGWLRKIERLGMDPVVLLVMPRVLGAAIGAFCLGIILIFSALASGYLVARTLGIIAYSIWDFGETVLRAMSVLDFVVPPAKCIVIGVAVVLVCCATGLARHDQSDELQRVVRRGFVRATLAILLVNGIFDLIG
jgi:phospholipid/cholesterol/gamma-HCH transport system permease protein